MISLNENINNKIILLIGYYVIVDVIINITISPFLSTSFMYFFTQFSAINCFVVSIIIFPAEKYIVYVIL